jgi:iron complex outermembrane recepter protein
MRRAALAVAATLTVAAAAAQAPPFVPLPGVDVIGTTPLPGLGAPAAEVPGNVQVFSGREVGRQRPLTVADFLDANPSSVNLNTATGNPFQPDVNFRGFTASPLLGTPQGLSVFQDGVRINEVFGDVVNWDLIPTAAIASIQVIPGSNPVFGLNTLGGALAIYTKTGVAYPGTTVDGYGGSFGRGALSFETGGVRESVDWYATGNFVSDHGWRDHSASRVRQLFGKLGWQGDETAVFTSIALADNVLDGTQTLPISMLSAPQQAYTWPDSTDNRLAFVNAQGTRTIDDAAIVTGNAYFRQFTSGSVNSNVNGNFDPDVADSPPAFNVQSNIASRGWGATAQLTLLPTFAGHRNRFTLGIAADLGDTDFTQSEQPAGITAFRETPGIGPPAPDADVRTTTRNYALYATDTLAFADSWTATVSARYNEAQVTLADRSGVTPALNGRHTYSRVNPAAGITWAPAPSATIYASWSQGMRVPSPVELVCADPNAPCTLPNIFVADPALSPVVATTVEMGARGAWGEGTFWSAALYRTGLADDIQFIAAGKGAVNAGYFQNIGRTRRQGVELGIGTPLRSVTLTARYSYTQATFETGFLEASPNNSTATDGVIAVVPGDSLPAIPRQLVKLRGAWTVTPAIALGATLIAASRQFARGNENNLDPQGIVPGYAIVNLEARWRLDPRWEIFANVGNLFNTRYQNFGILGANYFRGPANTFAPALAGPEEFRAPAPPFGGWLGIQFSFSGRKD